MAHTNVAVLNQVWLGKPNEWQVGLQWCAYIYPNEPADYGYRFIWRRPNGTLQAARGQARIPSLPVANRLIELARAEGWADNAAADAAEWL